LWPGGGGGPVASSVSSASASSSVSASAAADDLAAESLFRWLECTGGWSRERRMAVAELVSRSGAEDVARRVLGVRGRVYGVDGTDAAASWAVVLVADGEAQVSCAAVAMERAGETGAWMLDVMALEASKVTPVEETLFVGGAGGGGGGASGSGSGVSTALLRQQNARRAAAAATATGPFFRMRGGRAKGMMAGRLLPSEGAGAGRAAAAAGAAGATAAQPGWGAPSASSASSRSRSSTLEYPSAAASASSPARSLPKQVLGMLATTMREGTVRQEARVAVEEAAADMLRGGGGAGAEQVMARRAWMLETLHEGGEVWARRSLSVLLSGGVGGPWRGMDSVRRAIRATVVGAFLRALDTQGWKKAAVKARAGEAPPEDACWAEHPLSMIVYAAVLSRAAVEAKSQLLGKGPVAPASAASAPAPAAAAAAAAGGGEMAMAVVRVSDAAVRAVVDLIEARLVRVVRAARVVADRGIVTPDAVRRALGVAGV
jgi:hypothetical protein